MKITKKLASAGSLEAITKLIAEFYYTTPARIFLAPNPAGFWAVQSGEKFVSPIVVFDGKRYVFGMGK